MRNKKFLQRLLSLLLVALMAVNLFPWSLAAYALEEESQRQSGVSTSGELICGQNESVGHTHNESCYCLGGELICGEAESEGHIHDEYCYDYEGNLCCGLDESAGHTHDESCYCPGGELICSKDESAGHTHDAGCYAQEGPAIGDKSSGSVMGGGGVSLRCTKARTMAQN